MRLSELKYDQNSGLFLLPVNEQEFTYSDGSEIENYILESLKKTDDVSYESEQLFPLIKNWPTYYHLGPGRANILRIIELMNDSKVLELGCGCGAITRYLGERFNAVDALEGSHIRARITRQRCRDLRNVKVFCSNIDQIDFEPEYDIVTLIGVLEYAPMFFGKSPKDSCSLMLKSAKTALKKNGILVIAIENKIGLKYWTGFPEEHTGKFYEGIYGYPNEKSPVTFSKKELEYLLNSLGLKNINFYYCFPDYKFASTIFSDLGHEKDLYLHNWVDVPFKTYGLPKKCGLHEGLTLRTLSKAGLLREMANSFLVVASETDSFNTIQAGWAAKKISGFPRKKQYQCITTLKVTPDLRIEKKQIHNKTYGIPEVSKDAFFIQKFYDSPWYSGDLLSFDIFESLFHSSFKESVKKVLTLFYNHLIENFFEGKTDKEGYPLVGKISIDFIFRNFVKHNDELKHIDTEWHSRKDVPIDLVLYRCILNDIISVSYPDVKSVLGDPEELILELIKNFFPKYDRERLSQNKRFDRQFQIAVSTEHNPESIFGPVNVFKDSVYVELEAAQEQLKNAHEELKTIHESKSWKLILCYRMIKGKIFPYGK